DDDADESDPEALQDLPLIAVQLAAPRGEVGGEAVNERGLVPLREDQGAELLASLEKLAKRPLTIGQGPARRWIDGQLAELTHDGGHARLGGPQVRPDSLFECLRTFGQRLETAPRVLDLDQTVDQCPSVSRCHDWCRR